MLLGMHEQGDEAVSSESEGRPLEVDRGPVDMSEDMSRRRFLASASVAAVSVSGLLSACGGSSSGGSSSGTSPTSTTAAGQPKRGGKLQVGMETGGPTDTLDPGKIVTGVDYARVGNLFDRLATLKTDMSTTLELAESFEPNKQATEWTIRLRKGVMWHDGKPLTADDVIYTFNRIVKGKLNGASTVSLMNLPAIRKRDSLTLTVPMKVPIGDLPSELTIFYFSIVQNGATDASFKTKPIGTGPFMFSSWTPGQRSAFTRNPHYWLAGKPYLGELDFITISDSSARVNAVLGGQVDAIEALSFAQAKAQKSAGQINVLESPAQSIVPITMAVNSAPFNDVRVRQAMRLIADREQILQSAQLGFGAVGNDLYGKGTLDYNDSLPQRAQDIDQAKSLLKAAGRSGLTVTLNSSTAESGMLESATAFSQQAKAAGVKVQINNIPNSDFFGPRYLKYVFGQTEWPAYPIITWMTQALAAQAPYNETHWEVASWNRLFARARGAVDPAKRKEAMFELQKVLYDKGGYLIWGFFPRLDGLAKKVKGAVPNAAQPLSNFQLRDYWLA
jgi:peptide/nickel transport system substrate-binding protein